MATRPSDGTIFVWSNGNTVHGLYTVDPTTGVAAPSCFRVPPRARDHGDAIDIGRRPIGTYQYQW